LCVSLFLKLRAAFEEDPLLIGHVGVLPSHMAQLVEKNSALAVEVLVAVARTDLITE
jgi:hypothetical protein